MWGLSLNFKTLILYKLFTNDYVTIKMTRKATFPRYSFTFCEFSAAYVNVGKARGRSLRVKLKPMSSL